MNKELLKNTLNELDLNQRKDTANIMIQHYLKNQLVQWQQLEQLGNKPGDWHRVGYTGTVDDVDDSNTLALISNVKDHYGNYYAAAVIRDISDLDRVKKKAL